MAKKAKKHKKRGGFKRSIMSVFGLLTAIVFIPTTALLAVGMLPTLVARLIDTSKKGTKALTVGAMNLAGCSPFLLKLWTVEHSLDHALSLVAEPQTIVVIYAAAGIGYIIDWTVSGIVKTFLYQNAQSRTKDIETIQQTMIERWGREVTGDIPLNEFGFPLEKEERATDQLPTPQ